MSVRLIAAVFDRVRGLSHLERLVLLKLADYANDAGLCFPLVSTIADQLETNPRSVQRSLSALDDAGLIERRYRRGRSTVYRVTLDATDELDDRLDDELAELEELEEVTAEGVTEVSPPPDESVTPPLTRVSPPPDESVTHNRHLTVTGTVTKPNTPNSAEVVEAIEVADDGSAVLDVDDGQLLDEETETGLELVDVVDGIELVEVDSPWEPRQVPTFGEWHAWWTGVRETFGPGVFPTFGAWWVGYRGLARGRPTGSGGRNDAARAFAKLDKAERHDAADQLAAYAGWLLVQDRTRRGDPFPSRHGSTWLNRRGWEDAAELLEDALAGTDDSAAGTVPGLSSSRPSSVSAADRAALDALLNP